MAEATVVELAAATAAVVAVARVAEAMVARLVGVRWVMVGRARTGLHA